MSQAFSDGSQWRPWHWQAQYSQCSQVQRADGDGARITLDGNGLDPITWPSSRRRQSADVARDGVHPIVRSPSNPVPVARRCTPTLLWWGGGQTAPALRPPRRDLRGRELALGDDRLLGGFDRPRAVERARRDPDRAGPRRGRTGRTDGRRPNDQRPRPGRRTPGRSRRPARDAHRVPRVGRSARNGQRPGVVHRAAVDAGAGRPIGA